jgi:hypothetical protein
MDYPPIGGQEQGGNQMNTTITALGWMLVSLGTLSYLVALGTFAYEKFGRSNNGGRRNTRKEQDPKEIWDVIADIADLLEKFSKLSTNVQWALMGFVPMAAGIYLLAKDLL